MRVLGEYLDVLLERLSTPATAGGGDLALIEPATPAWIVGSIGVGYDEAADRVVLVIEEVREQDEAEAEESDQEEEEEEEAQPEVEEAETESEEEGGAGGSDRASGRVRLTRAQVAAFVERARGLIEAGRPTCRPCGRPMNAGGHRCARTNGPRLRPVPVMTRAAAIPPIELRTRRDHGEGRLPWASNATFLVEVTRGRSTALGVYKPQRGERPLWDFPAGSTGAEVAAYSAGPRRSGGASVPPTLERDGPYGQARSNCSWTPISRSTTSRSASDRSTAPRSRASAPSISWRNNADRKERALPPRSGRTPVCDRQRPLLPRGVQAADGGLGSRGRADSCRDPDGRETTRRPEPARGARPAPRPGRGGPRFSRGPARSAPPEQFSRTRPACGTPATRLT